MMSLFQKEKVRKERKKPKKMKVLGSLDEYK